MAKDVAKQPRTVNRRIRTELVHINGVPVKFYRCPKKRRWMWRAIGGRIQLPTDRG